MFDILLSSYPMFLEATFLTLRLTAISLIMGCGVGLLIAFFRISHSKALQTIAHVYITVIRGTPLIVQIMVLYFGITEIVTLSSFWAGAFALAIHNGAYIAETFRGSIQSIDRGQMEAAKSLGMSYPLAMRRIILPQAFKRAIPPLGNQFIIGLKDSSLVAYVGMQELWGTGLGEAASNYRQLDTYLVVGLYYLVLVLIFTYVVNRLENRLNTGAAKKKSKGYDSASQSV
ncbi:amino acid ABC transporter permease [Brevibacillus borstelensis]|jgi:polar amino acid transport system permease protein|uniref:amino acid ABC transporter permease n=1 Tax=Brevibacillus borstelensis TaxID=45462 RepID=UPI003D1C18CC